MSDAVLSTRPLPILQNCRHFADHIFNKSCLRFRRSLLLRFELPIFHSNIVSDNGLTPTKPQVIIWTNDDYCTGLNKVNKENLMDLIAAAGLVILLKLDSNRRFCSPCDLEIWWMTSNNNTPPLYTLSSFVHHFKSIGEFKLELQSGKA